MIRDRFAVLSGSQCKVVALVVPAPPHVTDVSIADDAPAARRRPEPGR
ncbi:hypothetical protein HDA32_005279 [Spinactinospora alkalitolerans]|uniref:Uncharacterized protein n=1 Tax=Spinactinospora alkalitolerans TaxID=687207 RepID=A0A852U1T0_9ACTN|nr:hypothetical protein [Spinactinospora alkalitolerans]NYE50159.1 hypothetical protein [Spinactinospora alkalitolerans]